MLIDLYDASILYADKMLVGSVVNFLKEKEHIFVYVVPLKKIKNTKIKDSRHFLIFSREGEFIKKQNISIKHGYMFFQITDDMFLLGARSDNEIEKIVISKIAIIDS